MSENLSKIEQIEDVKKSDLVDILLDQLSRLKKVIVKAHEQNYLTVKVTVEVGDDILQLSFTEEHIRDLFETETKILEQNLDFVKNIDEDFMAFKIFD